AARAARGDALAQRRRPAAGAALEGRAGIGCAGAALRRDFPADSRRHLLRLVEGGGGAAGDPCEALHFHGYIGMEKEAVGWSPPGSATLGPEDFPGIHEAVGVEGALDGAHEVELERALVARDLVHLEQAEAMLGADRSAELAHHLVHHVVHFRRLLAEEAP